MSARPDPAYPFRLFERTGVELEYMIVRRDTLDVLPVADRLLSAAAGAPASDVEVGPLGWSNELALHVVEFKTTEPVPDLGGVAGPLQESVRRAEQLLDPMDARLLPTAMHPWMDPARDMRIWPHDSAPIYNAFDRIFGCRGHGWANLQSAHLNLPFASDQRPQDEFGRLHAAIRLVLPILPALAASSPIMDGRATGLMDNRIAVYRTNSARVPSVAGAVIPEPVFTRDDYQRHILDPLYADLAPLDPDHILRHEWANARGCIARFERGSIEIRLLDVQECPAADAAVCAVVVAAVRALVEERWIDLSHQQSRQVQPLAAILSATTRDAERAVIDDPEYLRAFGLPESPSRSAADLWSHIIEQTLGEPAGYLRPLALIQSQGPLARRIIAALRGDTGRGRLREVYGRLADCLREGVMFREPA